jgi:outer membrane protein
VIHIAGSILLAISAVSQQDSAIPVVTLDEARRRAAAVDPVSVTARNNVSTASSELRSSRIDLYTPNVLASTSYTRFSEPFFNFGTGAITPNATSATLQANYVMWGSGKFAELKRSRASLASAEANEVAASFGTALETDAAYFAVLADQELSRVAAERLRRAQEQFTIARARVLAGEAIATDSLQLMLEVVRARLGIIRRDSAIAVSRLRLGRQIGLAGPADAAPIDSVAPPELPISEADAIRELRTRGPEIEAARAAEQVAEATLNFEKEGYHPDISIGATTGAYDSRMFPSALHRSQLSVAVSLPIWDGGRRELQVARARAQRNVATAQRLDQERAAASLMADAYHGYTTSRAGIELAQVGVAVATEAFRVQRTRYREGATTILDLMEAQVALSEAEAALVQSRYSTRLSLAQIEALLGRRVIDR